MKTKFTIIILILLSVLVVSCASHNKNVFNGNEIAYEKEFDESYEAWLKFKDTSNNSYTYTVRGSSWTRLSWETDISIINGVVTQRKFRYLSSVESLVDDIEINKRSWLENEDEINTHEELNAAYPYTLDEIYEKSKTSWLVKEKDISNFFSAHNKGLISVCGYVHNGCMDDCFVGIRISEIKALE